MCKGHESVSENAQRSPVPELPEDLWSRIVWTFSDAPMNETSHDWLAAACCVCKQMQKIVSEIEVDVDTQMFKPSANGELRRYDCGDEIPKFLSWRRSWKVHMRLPDTVRWVGAFAFAGCTSLASVTIPKSTTGIKMGAFEGCTGLQFVCIGDSVSHIDSSAFRACWSLTHITIPDSVVVIGFGAFTNCYRLNAVILGNSVQFIGPFAFMNCVGLTSVTIPPSTRSVDDRAFVACAALKNVTVHGSNTLCHLDAFEGCTSLCPAFVSELMSRV